MNAVVTDVAPVLEVRGVTKRFGPNTVLSGVDLTLRPGEVHALLGENGAGKSTLTKIIGGALRPDDGTVDLDGAPTAFRDPGHAVSAGISTVYQELNLIPSIDVAGNIMLGRERTAGPFLRAEEMRRGARAALELVGSTADPSVAVETLSTGERQLVEIARALSSNARVIMMDEPTAALSSGEIDRLHAAVRRVTERGIAIVYISHKLDEVMRIADRVSVLRDGRLVRTADTADLSRDEIVSLMLGRGLAADGARRTSTDRDRTIGDVVLSVRGLTVPGKVVDVGFDVHRGEILGFAGLVGAGRSETFRALVGLEHVTAGGVSLDGRSVRFRSPRAALRSGVVVIPEDRKTQGLLLGLSIADNIALPHLDSRSVATWVRTGSVRKLVDDCIETFGIRPSDARIETRFLSGGNQQKVLIGRWLLRSHRVVVFDEPSKGVDVGARAAIWDMIRSVAADGAAVVVISSETEELLALADRIAVLRDGGVSRVLDNTNLTEDEVMEHAF